MGWHRLRAHLKELFSAKAEGAGTDQSAATSKENRERKMSSSSSGSMKSKWLSAFKSLKSGGQSSNQQQQDK
ncbi:hypothetical protein B566_EDAN004605 [Ephemera danica]|nr:hypothetical protein B566_EDAN004605 [Ephemera danica]